MMPIHWVKYATIQLIILFTFSLVTYLVSLQTLGSHNNLNKCSAELNNVLPNNAEEVNWVQKTLTCSWWEVEGSKAETGWPCADLVCSHILLQNHIKSPKHSVMFLYDLIITLIHCSIITKVTEATIITIKFYTDVGSILCYRRNYGLKNGVKKETVGLNGRFI